MASVDTIFAIHSYLNREDLGLERKENEGQCYYLLYVFNEKTLIPREELIKIYNQTAPLKMPDELPVGYIGPFESLEGLNQYAFALGDNLGAEKVALASIEDFNETVKSVNSTSDFTKALLEHSNVIANPNNEKKKSLFGKLFN